MSDLLRLRLCVFVIALLGIGCEPHLDVGEGCVRNSECAEPLACLIGRCRVQCVADRDCGPGLRCVMASPEVGVCTVPAEEDCSGSCDAPLVCRDGQCRNTCDEDTACGTGSACVEGTCVPSSMVPDAGPPDGGASFRSCDSDADCMDGEVCADEYGVEWCTPICGEADLCPGDSVCDALETGGYGCSIVCIPGTEEGCPSGNVCSMTNNSGRVIGADETMTVCRTKSAGWASEGCPCGDGSAGWMTCAGGLVCSDAANDGHPVCARACATPGSESCGDTIACLTARDIGVDVGGVTYGVCDAPAVAPTDCPAP